MPTLHFGIKVGLLVIVTTIAGCGRNDGNRSTDTAQAIAPSDSQSSSVPAPTMSGSSTEATPAPAVTEAPATAPAKSITPAGATGGVVDVQMLGDASGYRFTPTTITVKRGGRVRWTMVSGAPHNVAFWPDSIPPAAATKLGTNMPRTMAPLTGPFLMAQDETYEVSFAGLPAGTYRYFCTPHLALGMKGIVRVE